MEKLVRYSTCDIRYSNGEASSIFDIRYSNGEFCSGYLTFDIRYSNGENSSIFDIQMEKLVRYSIFELPLLIILLGSNVFFGIRKATEYQVFNIKTNF